MNNDLLLRALRCEAVERPPVWLMRQAGRYMPEYKQLRAQHSLDQLFHDPVLAAQVTLQPIERLGVDAAILFSDILVVLEVFGLNVTFPLQGGPQVSPLVSTEQIGHLPKRCVRSTLHYVFETIKRLKPQLKVPLIGFSGAPFTLATYMLDSTRSPGFEATKRWLAQHPSQLESLLDQLTDVVIAYTQEQISAGVDAIQLFDSWANLLDEEQFDLFCAPYLARIVHAIQERNVPVIVFCRGSSVRIKQLSALSPSAISCDEEVPLLQLRQELSPAIALQGNFSPHLLLQTKEEIHQAVTQALAAMKGKKGWIANLGHGVLPQTPVENVSYFVDLIRASGLH